MKIYRIAQTASQAQGTQTPPAPKPQFPMTPYQVANPQTMMRAKPGNQTIVKAKQAVFKQLNNMVEVSKELHAIEEFLDAAERDYGIEIPFDVKKMMTEVTSGNPDQVKTVLEGAKRLLAARNIPGISSQIDQAIRALSNVNRKQLDDLTHNILTITRNFVDPVLNNIAKGDILDLFGLNRMMAQLSADNPMRGFFYGL